MKDRIRLFIGRENKTSSQFAEEIGIQPSAVSHVLSGRNNPSLDFVVKMLTAYPELNTDWLLFGKGEMYRTETGPTLFESEKDDNSGIDDSGLKDMSLFNNITGQKDPAEIVDNTEIDAIKDTGDTFSERIIIFYPDGTYNEYKSRK
ncbi:MAG: helix-turn-helix transcriptional regulator [Bacteroidales bacterium]|nr:helix-turn-helix transcriptional regulator [Bacteroidales bacterium]